VEKIPEVLGRPERVVRSRLDPGFFTRSDRRHEERKEPMAKKRPITVWYDREGDFLEVLFERKPGYFRQTSSEGVMEKVDNEGKVIGFHVLHVTRLTQPLELKLAG
jgi:hypothetical protein